jgi:hypothetical protein
VEAVFYIAGYIMYSSRGCFYGPCFFLIHSCPTEVIQAGISRMERWISRMGSLMVLGRGDLSVAYEFFICGHRDGSFEMTKGKAVGYWLMAIGIYNLIISFWLGEISQSRMDFLGMEA